MIAKAQSASNNIDRDATMQTSMTQQSFLYVVLLGATTIKDEGKGRTKRLPCNNQTFMLSFAGCKDDHIKQCNNQQCKYTKVNHSEYARDGVYIAKGMYIAKGKYNEYAKDSVYLAMGKYGKHAKLSWKC
jgi:hypothetical protein